MKGEIGVFADRVSDALTGKVLGGGSIGEWISTDWRSSLSKLNKVRKASMET